MFFWIAFLIFTGRAVRGRLLRLDRPAAARPRNAGRAACANCAPMSGRAPRASSDLFRQRAAAAPSPSLGDFFAWIGVLRRLQAYIDQANLKYRAADVFALSIAIAVVIFFMLFGLAGHAVLLLRLLISVLFRRASRSSISCASARAGCPSSKNSCPTPSTCSPAPCAPATTSTAVSKPSPPRPSIRSRWNSRR